LEAFAPFPPEGLPPFFQPKAQIQFLTWFLTCRQDFFVVDPAPERKYMKLRSVDPFAVLLAGSFCIAQSKQGDLVADVPFAFVVAQQTLPAGHYVVSRLNDDLNIHGGQNRGALVPAHPAQPPDHKLESKLVFHRYGDAYFLSEVWVAGNTVGRELYVSRAERKLKESGREREIAVVRMER
jgi:hypothetical protein